MEVKKKSREGQDWQGRADLDPLTLKSSDHKLSPNIFIIYLFFFTRTRTLQGHGVYVWIQGLKDESLKDIRFNEKQQILNEK